MKVVKGNLDGSPEIDMNSMYLVDFSKCESVNDLMTILSVIGFTFSPQHPGFEHVKKFLALEQPIPNMRAHQQPIEEKELKLPKLKPLK